MQIFLRKNRFSGSQAQTEHLKEGAALIFDKCCEQILCSAVRGKGWSRALTAVQRGAGEPGAGERGPHTTLPTHVSGRCLTAGPPSFPKAAWQPSPSGRAVGSGGGCAGHCHPQPCDPWVLSSAPAESLAPAAPIPARLGLKKGRRYLASIL